MFIRCLLFFNQLDGGSNYKKKLLTIKVSDVTGCTLAILYLIGFLLHIIDKSEMSLNGSLSFTVSNSFQIVHTHGWIIPWFISVSEQTILGKICDRKDLWREVAHITGHWAKFSNKHFQQYHYCHDYERLNIYWAPLWLQIFYIHTVRSSFKFVLCALVNISGIEEIWSRLKKIKD